MEDYDYIKSYYKVPAETGRDVIVNGKKGTIKESLGQYIGVIFHDDEKAKVMPCHPTSEVEYLDTFTEVKKLYGKKWRSKQRYQEYLRVADCYNNFHHFLISKK